MMRVKTFSPARLDAGKIHRERRQGFVGANNRDKLFKSIYSLWGTFVDSVTVGF
jgi:hypothetical protein